MKILAVDDEAFILELLPMLAARVGFPEVATVSSGDQALDVLLAAETAFDCLVLDINMPGMDGIELCRQVRQIEAYRKTPIIMLTAMSDREFIDKAFKAGATDYATKPFDINELGARLRMAEELHTARRELESARVLQVSGNSIFVDRQRIDLKEAISIDGIRDLIDFTALANYLKQCSRAGLGALQIVAVTIDQIEDLHAHSTTDEFIYALREVADAIIEVLKIRGGLFSYSGSGAFVVISTAVAPLNGRELETEIQHLLDEKNSEFDDGSPMDIEVSVGSPIQPNYNEVAEIPSSLQRAIARAQSRSIEKRGANRQVNIRVTRV